MDKTIEQKTTELNAICAEIEKHHLSVHKLKYNFKSLKYEAAFTDGRRKTADSFEKMVEILAAVLQECLDKKSKRDLEETEENRLVEVFNKFLKERRTADESSITPIHRTTCLLCDDHTTAPLPPYDGDRQLFLDVLRVHLHLYLLKHSTIMLGSFGNLYHVQNKPWDVIVAELNPIIDNLIKNRQKVLMKKTPQKWRDVKWLQAKYYFKFVDRWKITKHTFEKCEKAVGSLVAQSGFKFFDATPEPSMLMNADGSMNMRAMSIVNPSTAPVSWEKLREEVKKYGGIRNKTMMARLPGPYESTATVMSGTSPGIYPVHDGNYLRANNAKSLYYQNSKRDGEKTDEQNQSNQTPGPEQGSPTGTQGNDSGSSQEDRQS